MTTLTPAQEGITAGTWQLDGAHSRLGFSVEYMAGTFQAFVASFEATLTISADNSRLTGVARAESIVVQDEDLATHLLSPEFFDAEQSPALTFSSRSLVIDGREVLIEGDVKIKGVTQPVRLTGTLRGPVVDPYGRERINLVLEGVVDRRLFGLDWNVTLPSGEPALSNDVTLAAELALIRE
jgi:polyisoprenoid-binding protein YceI